MYLYRKQCEIERFRQNFWPTGYLQSLLAMFPKNHFPAIFGDHLEFLRKTKNAFISETLRDRAIWTKCLTHRVSAQCTFPQNRFPAILATILNFCVFQFLCQLTCQSADIMSSLCGVGVHVNNFFSKTTRPRDMLFFLKIPYLSRMKNCSRHANLSVRLFARDITRGVPSPKV